MSLDLSPMPEHVLWQTKHIISNYHLLEPGQEVIVAYSGGKDSLFTMLVLRELGYCVLPAIVDMGYEAGWGDKVKQMAETLGFHEAEVIVPNQYRQPERLSTIKLNKNLEMLSDSQHFASRVLSPCTFCYNTKAICLENFAKERGVDAVVFGQHALDAIASFLKSALMYIDRWDYEHTHFSHSEFSNLVDRLTPNFMPSEAEPAIFKRLEALVADGVAATDDPPMQKLNANQGNIRLIRPLFDVRESDIIAYVRQNNLLTEGSGCGHGDTKETQTPREMIYFRILRAIDEHPEAKLILDELMALVYKGLNPDGSLIHNVRNQRNQLLGIHYKGSMKCSTVKE